MSAGTMIGEGWEVPVFAPEEGRRRWKRIRDLMYDRQLDCLLIGGSTYNYRSGYGDIRYVSNTTPNSDDAYVLFPFEGDPVLYVWSPLSQYHCEKTSWMEVDHCQWTRKGHTYPQLMAAKLKDLGLERGTLGFVDEYSWLAYAYERLRELLPLAKFVDAGEILRATRRVKSAAELEYVRKAGECADKGWEALKNAVRLGATKYDLIAELECAMVKNGAEVSGMNLLDVKQWSSTAGSRPCKERWSIGRTSGMLHIVVGERMIPMREANSPGRYLVQDRDVTIIGGGSASFAAVVHLAVAQRKGGRTPLLHRWR